MNSDLYSTEMEDYDEWLELSEEDVIFYENLVKEYGYEYLYEATEEDINNIEKLYKKKFHNCIKKWFKEENYYPVSALDFSSLYPSLMMCYNLSPEYIIPLERMDYAKELVEKGHTLHKIEFDFSGKKQVGWVVWHDNKIDEEHKENGTYKFGIFPDILRELFNKRAKMKKLKNKLEHEIEEMDRLDEKTFNEEKIKKKYKDLNFNFNYIDAKQKALKVLMNSMYGCMGMKISPIFDVLVAGGITSFGQMNLTYAENYLRDIKKCKIWYGDTDSLYFSNHKSLFSELDTLYYSNNLKKINYWEEIVKIAIENVKILEKEVNNFFLEKNKTRFLRMAWEEVLFPVAFLSKKKYYGIPHIGLPNFNYKKLFIRGLDIKKRGISEFVKDISKKVLDTSVSHNNNYTLLEIVLKTIDDIYNNKEKLNPKLFCKTDMYRPNRQNIRVQSFVKRMKNEYNKIIQPLDRFKYVIEHKYPYKYTLSGKKINLSTADYMTLYEEGNNYNIDLDYYMKGSLNGILARIITYHKQFSSNLDGISNEKEKQKKIYDNACSYINDYNSKYYKNYKSKGKIYQKIYKLSRTITNDILVNPFDNISNLNNGDYISKIFKYTSIDTLLEENNLIEFIIKECRKKCLSDCKKHAKKFITSKLKNIKDQNEKNNIIIQLQKKYYLNKKNIKDTNNINNINNKIYEYINTIDHSKIKQIYSIHNNIIKYLINNIKKMTNIDNKFINNNEKFEDKMDIIEKLGIDTNILKNNCLNIFNKIKVGDMIVSSTPETGEIINVSKEPMTPLFTDLIEYIKELYSNIYNIIYKYEENNQIIQYLKTNYNKIVFISNDIINKNCEDFINNNNIDIDYY